MKGNVLALGLALLAAVGLLFQITTVQACEADGDEKPRCISWRFPRAEVSPNAIVVAPTITRTLVAAVIGTNTPALPATWTPLASLTPLPTFTPTFSPTPRVTPTATPSPTSSTSTLLSPLETLIVELVPFPTETPTSIDFQNGIISPTPTFSPTPTLASSVAGQPTPTRTRTNTLAARSTASPTANKTTTTKRGDSPFSAVEVSGVWEKIEANSYIWYKTGVETSYPLRFSLALDAYGRGGINFAVYAPEQASDLSVATPPKGRGAHDKSVPHDLIWSGGSPLAGLWYVLVTNINPFPMDYKLISSLAVTERKNCYQYWEHIGKDYVLWTECNR